MRSSTRSSRSRLTSAVAATAMVLGVVALVQQAPDGDPATGPAAAAPAVAPAVAQRPRAMPRKPNMVVVMADDMRYDDLRFAPQIRRLITRNGLKFANAFSNYPLCCPARASFLTGKLAHNHKVWTHEKPFGYQSFDDSRTLATALRGSGYRTGFVGKYLNGYGPDRSRVSGGPSYKYVPRGWDQWAGAIENPGRDGIHGGTYFYYDTPYNRNGRIDNSYRGRYQTDVIGDLSLDMLGRVRGRKPFFLYLNYVAPHHGAPGERDDPGVLRTTKGQRTDYVTPARPGWVRGKFDKQIPRAAGRPRRGGPAELNMADKPPNMRKWPELTEREWSAMREVTRQRAESIFVMDKQVGRLVKRLKATGEWQDTVLMFTSDNGYFLGEHRRRPGKVLPHDPSLRVPLVMTGPGMRSGEVRYDPISTVDLTATLLDLGRARLPWTVDGTSRVSSLVRDRGWRQPVITEATGTGAGTKKGFRDRRTTSGLRTSRYAYFRNRGGVDELYDLARDPFQLSSVVTQKRYRPVLRQLRDTWFRVQRCKGGGCRVSLPAELRADPSRNRQRGIAFSKKKERVYGFRD